MALYDIVTNNPAVASDVEQLINVFNGKHDIGTISLAPTLSAPAVSNFTLTAQTGSSLGAGAYNYQFTYLTGQYKSDGITMVKTGETLPTSALAITTTAGNTNVYIALPSSLPNSVIAINIYRTSVGGTDYKLVATVKAGNNSYTDSTADASRGTQTIPSTNTTGTYFQQEAWNSLTLQNGWVAYATSGNWGSPQFYKNDFNEVFVKGIIKNGTATTSTVIGTLPSGYRPLQLKRFTVFDGANSAKGIDINPDGTITLSFTVNNAYLVIDLPPFRAEQ